jgi:hypothetical protein
MWLSGATSPRRLELNFGGLLLVVVLVVGFDFDPGCKQATLLLLLWIMVEGLGSERRKAV